MFIKTKKRGEIEVGGDEGLSKALSEAFGPILDEMYDITVKDTTIVLWPDDELTVCVAIGGDNADDPDLITVGLEKLVKDAVGNASKSERAEVIKRLCEIAESIK